MEFDIEKDEIILASGNRFYAYGGVIGLSVDPSDNMACYGWDGTLGEMSDESLSKQDRKEIAEYMIQRWREYGELE